MVAGIAGESVTASLSGGGLVVTQLFDSLGLQGNEVDKAIATLIILIVAWLLRRLILREANKRLDDAEVKFRTRKGVTYVTAFLVVTGLVVIWVPSLEGVGTFFGFVAAGLVIALADVVVNFAGWIYILLRHPFRVGDRIEVGDLAGDVIDTRLLRFTLLEIGNWVMGDQSTGRIVHVPNGTVFRQPVANYTDGFHYIWHEVALAVTFESEWERAEATFLEILNRHAATDAKLPAETALKHATRKYFIRFRELAPIVYVEVIEYGVMLHGRILVDARQRRTINDQIWREVLRAVAEDPAVEFAYPTNRTILSHERRPDAAQAQPLPPEFIPPS